MKGENEMGNKLQIGTRVFSIHHSDGKAHPTHYWLEYEGKVIRCQSEKSSVVEWKKEEDTGLLGHCIYGTSEDMFLKPSVDGFCYYMSELPDMEGYKDGDLYKVPTGILKQHMKSYQSPWK